MSDRPISLQRALASFDALWSPRIVTRVNDYDVRIAKVAGEHVWHAHDSTDEFFLVIEGELHICLREPEGERTVLLRRGEVFTVPAGTEHRPHAPAGAAILMFEPTGTPTVGDRHEDVPAHVDATTGHVLWNAELTDRQNPSCAAALGPRSGSSRNSSASPGVCSSSTTTSLRPGRQSGAGA
ncbi:mannose-6-phosphate isomerase-like protein (cupin superfamily) [Kitasatospora viridis]|uniref:Mannose-6-phosphate isomerase-like protein (Cupin superfamily) n=1 Tax=Kitasatospora viridis TaxID=281105 RepID=A0A561T6K6_9ACTN|nr:mannose-6-phosphate isomerase-like protein (cupin superfamily) [Kitasatospora viridis]